mmetsp:Transcript_20702/g.45000  ORF Transcript_20702/g.45000 Transcript_20702/m.45000 type:complete len:336 (-) Transcript_20702:709-1716(-)
MSKRQAYCIAAAVAICFTLTFCATPSCDSKNGNGVMFCGLQRGLLHLGASHPWWTSTYSAHWLLGALDSASATDDATQLGSEFQPTQKGANTLFATSSQLLHVVPRAPLFSALVRGAQLPSAPAGSVYVDRPPEASLVQIPVSCLRTRAHASLRTHVLTNWTVEVVTMFIDSPNFGRNWQTIIGRNGGSFSTDAFDSKLAGLYLKLSPSRRLFLQAWVNQSDVRYVSIESGHIAQPNTWYSIVARSDGYEMELFVNGRREGSAVLSPRASLAVPSAGYDGDFTIGCGMFENKTADACSCLISEARISEETRLPSSWLWVGKGPASTQTGEMLVPR